MAGARKLIFSDPTAPWVPFATVLIITGLVWWGIFYENDFEIGNANTFSLAVLAILVAGVFLQGWLYWTTQVDTLSLNDDGTLEARMMRWVGWGRKLRFTPAEATGWRTIARSTPKADALSIFSSIEFTVRGKEYSMSLLGPTLLDVAALQQVAPGFMAKVVAEDPGLRPVGV